MMNRCKLFILILLSVVVSSCDQGKGRFSPYTLSHYKVEGSVKSIIEKEYSNSSRLLYTKRFDFDESGKLLSFYHIEGRDTVTRYYIQYKDKGRIDTVQRKGVIEYTPEFNMVGDLLKETYITDTTGGVKGFTKEYEYDKKGNVIIEKTRDIETFITITNIDYIYEDNTLKQIQEWFDGETIFYNCDSTGLVISNKHDYPNSKNTTTGEYSYKYDNNSNWIEKVERQNQRLASTIKREILYYSEEELGIINTEDVFVPAKSYLNIAFIDNYINNVLSRSGTRGNSPGKVLFIILIVCSLIVTAISWNKSSNFLFHNFSGKLQSNGMKRLWMYNLEPYTKVGASLALTLNAFVISILLILLVGGLIWGILWIVKIILWAIVVIGWICLIGGICGLFAQSIESVIPLIIGGLIVAFRNDIKTFGNNLVTWGFEFMQSVNMFNWGLGIFVNYWDVILVIFVTPMVLFLAFALFVIFLNMLLNGVEFVVTRIYSIRRPCPICGSTATPDYIVGGKPHPVKLHPGIYGVFTQKSPVSGESIPTMLLNGRGKVTRKCKKCNSFINADTDNTVGTEIHIGIVGHRSSGKSYLLYSGLSSLMSTYPGSFSQIDADNDTRIESKKKRIDARDGIQTDVANKYRAVQLILKSKLRPVPYHLFFYDVAGEKFNASSSSHKTAMEFYRNVQSIVFIVDPGMLDISGTPASPKFIDWHSKNAKAEKYRIDGSFAVLKDILETVGRKSKKIDFNFVCTKTDMGYLTELGYSKAPAENEIEGFMRAELGLSNLINSAKSSFKKVRFFSVSAITSDTSGLNYLFVSLLEQRKVTL